MTSSDWLRSQSWYVDSAHQEQNMHIYIQNIVKPDLWYVLSPVFHMELTLTTLHTQSY